MTAAKKAEAKREVKPEVKQEVKPTPAPTATTKSEPAKPEAVSKQTATLNKLREAWTARGVDLSKMTTTQDGKYLFVTVSDNWPKVRIGATGGIELPEIRSYAKAWDAAIIGDELLKKQRERDAKKTAAATAPAPKPEEAKKPETPAVRKTKQHEQIERAMA